MMIRWLRLPMLYDYQFPLFYFLSIFFLNVCFSKHGFNLLMHCVVFFYFGCENGLHEHEWTEYSTYGWVIPRKIEIVALFVQH